ncbi:hypothetical protein [Chryseobacterium daecheongense]|uniref:Uncharacterized protein n=1 Tax=Chryseobacterium daecheongense TaxID=192389 RepID=A0A3N0VXY1_9FLAO|nr:hypothetical protein [Chryseobacterium daecheongense]ROH97676.1 hypothetical protein EGI05_09870 [Chryseobacterium daecheongense]TDX93165.1 hypothetical protein BCF50_2122 [Chryseobacterium daecheongense]
MKNEQNLEQRLIEICERFKLKEKALNSLEEIITDGLRRDEYFLNGYTRSEVHTVFEEYRFTILKKYLEATIDTRIGLYIDNDMYVDNSEPIGYYTLEVDFNGKIVDDVFVLEKEKYNK